MTQPVAPSPQEVNKFHANSDKDSASTAQHHSLGIDPNQASPGHHTHNGKNSKKIGVGLDTGFPTIASGAYNSGQIQALIDALRDLGFGT